VKTKRYEGGKDPAALAREIRSLQPALDEISGDVARIIGEVRERGDEAVGAISRRLGSPVASPWRVPGAETSAGLERIDPELRTALETAAANVRSVADAQSAAETEIDLPQGQSVDVREVPVGSAGIYAPGGTAGYPTSVIMGCVAARAAGVERVVLVSPGGEGGFLSDATLAAAAIAGADEVYAIGGPQAIAALAFGTETLAAVDVIAGPGNRYVTEAKRQVAGTVGIDGLAGPSELMVIAGDESDAGLVALDLCAQAEHGPDGLLVVAAVESGIIDAIAEQTEVLAADRESVHDAPLALVLVADTTEAAALAQALAPEHLEIVTGDAEMLAGGLTTPGCIFIGSEGATAFGDYIAGSNHVLPTGGAGRFQGPLGPGAFRRRIATVRMDGGSAAELAGPAATLARAEGFPVHGESMERRIKEPRR
jgi:histidinol dehydrogenase